MDGGGDDNYVKFFKLYMRGREARSWANIGAFRSLITLSMAEIFLMRELMGGRSHRLSDAGVRAHSRLLDSLLDG